MAKKASGIKTRKTSFKMTQSTKLLEDELVKEMDIPRTTFHRRAIDYYIKNGNRSVNPKLLITIKSHQDYVIKTELEQIYITEDREMCLIEIAKENNCGLTIVLFQVILLYCSVQAPIVLGASKMQEIMTY